MMDLDSAIQHCEEVAEEQEKLYRLCPASESGVFHCDGSKDCITLKNGKNKGCQKCVSEHRQLAEWLKELKDYRDARAEINQALYDDARGEQNDYERGRKSGIFLCESIISVKLREVKE